MEANQYLVASKHRSRILQAGMDAFRVWNRLERHLGGQAFEQGLLSVGLPLAAATQSPVVMSLLFHSSASYLLLCALRIAE